MSELLLALFLGLSPIQATPEITARDTTGMLYGRVLSSDRGTPVAGARVEARVGSEHLITLTDPRGRYRFRRLPGGTVEVTASALDHGALRVSVLVPAGRAVPLELRLEVQPVALPELRVSEARPVTLTPDPTSVSRLRRLGETTLRALDAGPAAGGLGAGGSDTGTPDPGDPSSVLYVRSAAADLKLVLLDGAPVYAPFHLSGLIDPFSADLLSSATLYTGGAPARFDGGVSYVLDLELREAGRDRLSSAGSLDVLSAQGRIEGPLGDDARILISARGLHGAGYPTLTGDDAFPYGYGDAIGRLDVDLGQGRLRATGFWNRESVDLEPATAGPPGVVAASETAFWGNRAGSVGYVAPAGGGSLSLLASHGTFQSRIPIQGDELAIAEGDTRRSRFETRFQRTRGTLGWAVGGAYDAFGSSTRETSLADSTREFEGDGRVAAAFTELAWRPDGDFEVEAGLRAAYFDPQAAVRLAPRVAVTWNLNERASLTLAGGRFHQFLRGPESILSSDLTGPTLESLQGGDPEAPFTPAPGELSVAGATHLVVGFRNELERSVTIGLEGFLKSFDGVPDAQGLRSSGADLWIHKDEGPVRGWVGYQLAWVWTDEDGSDSEFVGRQLLSTGLQSHLGAVDLDVRLTYGAGLPFTAVPVVPNSPDPIAGEGSDGPGGGGEQSEQVDVPRLSGAPDDSYLRLDARISRPWSARVGGAEVRIEPYLRLLNALDRRDALFYRSDQDEPGGRAPIASLPILPVLGVSWSF